MITKFKNVIASTLFILSFSTFASGIPDPEILAKQYLIDLCTLNEKDFVSKYMVTQADVMEVINTVNIISAEMDREPKEKISDSLAIRSEVQSTVLESYRSFKSWQKDYQIDSSKIKYHSCSFEVEKKREIPYYAIDKMEINFLYDTLKYKISCDEFLFIRTRWIGGESDGIYKVDKNFNRVYDEYVYDSEVAVDTVAAGYDYYEVSEEAAYEEYHEPLTKKQLKIEKKIDRYYHKIYLISGKQYE